MASNRVSKYSIELEIENGDKARKSIDDIERTLKSISETAKKDGLGMDAAKEQADELAKKIKEIAASEGDATAEIEAYSKAANRAISDLEKQSAKLTYSMTEQGKAQREKLTALKAELSALGDSETAQKKRKNLEKQIAAIQKDVIDATDDELSAIMKKNREMRATLKLSQSEAKLIQAQAKQNKTLSTYIKSDLKAIKDKIALQLKFIQTLKTTEGRYKALKAAAAKIGAGTAKLAKAGAVGGIGLLGGALAVGGMAVSGANSMVEREQEANRIKSSMSKEEKQQLLGDLYMQTGADYTTIVDAINRVTSVLGSGAKADDLAQATVAEIKYPGAAAMFRQQTTAAPTAQNFLMYQNRMKAIQGATGASVDQIQGATEKIANMRQSSFSNASMTDLLALYAGLQNSGAYDTQEELDRAFNSFVRSQKNSKDGVFEHAKSFDWQKRAYGATNRQQVQVALGNMDWNALESAAKTESTEITKTDAEKTAQKMRELEEKRNQVLMKLVEGLSPVLEAIDTKELSAFFDSMIKIVKDLAPAFGELTSLMLKIFKDIQPYLSKLVQFMSESLVKMIDAVNALYEGIKNSSLAKYLFDGDDDGVSGMARANGGVVSMPSIAGERGAEMVVPLDYSRQSRGRELTQNLNQYFNMAGNETTVMSLSQAVKSRDFTRAMANNSYLSGRLGR